MGNFMDFMSGAKSRGVWDAMMHVGGGMASVQPGSGDMSPIAQGMLGAHGAIQNRQQLNREDQFRNYLQERIKGIDPGTAEMDAMQALQTYGSRNPALIPSLLSDISGGNWRQKADYQHNLLLERMGVGEQFRRTRDTRGAQAHRERVQAVNNIFSSMSPAMQEELRNSPQLVLAYFGPESRFLYDEEMGVLGQVGHFTPQQAPSQHGGTAGEKGEPSWLMKMIQEYNPFTSDKPEEAAPQQAPQEQGFIEAPNDVEDRVRTKFGLQGAEPTEHRANQKPPAPQTQRRGVGHSGPQQEAPTSPLIDVPLNKMKSAAKRAGNAVFDLISSPEATRLIDQFTPANRAGGRDTGDVPPLFGFVTADTNVQETGMSPRMRPAGDIITKYFMQNKLGAPTVTSGVRDIHPSTGRKDTGFHGVGYAIDISMDRMTRKQISELSTQLRDAGYQVVTKKHGTGPHMHIELDDELTKRTKRLYTGR